MFAIRNKCHASSNKCLTSSNKKLLEATSTSLPPPCSLGRQAPADSERPIRNVPKKPAWLAGKTFQYETSACLFAFYKCKTPKVASELPEKGCPLDKHLNCREATGNHPVQTGHKRRAFQRAACNKDNLMKNITGH